MEAEAEVNEGAEGISAGTQSAPGIPAPGASAPPADEPIQLDDVLKSLEGAVDEAAESTTQLTHPPSQVASEAQAIVKEMSLQLSKAMMAGQLPPGSEKLLNIPLPITTASEGNERKRSSRHQKLVDELTGKLDMSDELKSEGLAWLNTGLAMDVKTWQTSAEGIRKLFEVPSAGKVNSSDGTEVSQPRGDIPQYLPHKTERLPKEWIVHCGRGETGVQYAVELSPQNSYEDIQNFPLKIKLSEPDQPWGAFGSVRAIRGSAAQSMSGVPSRYTMHTIGTIGSRLGRSKLSSSIVSLRSDGMAFDPKDEPIWQRGRRFDHVSDPHKKHFITVINTLNYDIKIMEATQATPLAEIKERYRCYNANIDNYVWKDIFEKQLDFDLTLHENGLVDNSFITDDTGLYHFPVIFLFFDDGFLNDPPMQLDIRKAFIRDPDILCRNYQLGMLPEPEEEDLETWCEPDRNIQDMPPDLRREFREKCAIKDRNSKEITEDPNSIQISKIQVNKTQTPTIIAPTTPAAPAAAQGKTASITTTADTGRRSSTSSSKAPPSSKAIISTSKLKKASATSRQQQDISRSKNESTNPLQKSMPPSAKVSSKYSSRPSESRKVRASQISQLPPEPKESSAAGSKVQSKVPSSVHAGQTKSKEAEFSTEE